MGCIGVVDAKLHCNKKQRVIQNRGKQRPFAEVVIAYEAIQAPETAVPRVLDTFGVSK